MKLQQSEKLKYERRWKDHTYRSRSALPFAHQLMDEFNIQGPALEIGCGDGTTMEILLNNGVDVQGCDITLAGYSRRIDINKTLDSLEKAAVRECPAWDLPYKDNEFYCTFSTDVLEHIPRSKIMAAVNEIIRVTQWITIHQIATFEMGEDHLTVRSISWWKNLFDRKDIESIILERST